MTGIRRALVLIGLTLAVMVGAAIPASATFADSAGVAGPTVTTITVPAPIHLEVKNVSCTSTVDPATSTVSAMIEWQRMATPRGGTGYRVTGHYSDGTTFEMAKTGATTFEVVGSWKVDLARSPRVSVTTLTRYGWTAQSTLIPVRTC
jgi:hypothetical protein